MRYWRKATYKGKEASKRSGERKESREVEGEAVVNPEEEGNQKGQKFY